MHVHLREGREERRECLGGRGELVVDLHCGLSAREPCWGRGRDAPGNEWIRLGWSGSAILGDWQDGRR